MKHPSFFRKFLVGGYFGLIFSLAVAPVPCQARGQAAPVPPLAAKHKPHQKPPLVAVLKPGHAPGHHHNILRGPARLDTDKYHSDPQQTIQGFRDI